jgi:DnaJ-class molecular chaperone
MAVKKKDYFLILGISRSESAEGVRAAFRKLAKKYHPDKSGPEGTRMFQDIAEAYSVLTDPDLRKEYIEDLQESEEQPRKHQADRAAKKHSSGRGHFRSESISGFSPKGRAPTTGEFSVDPSRNFPQSLRSGRATTIELELILSPGEAGGGGVLPAEVPVLFSCLPCCGSGEIGVFVCPRCRGRGFLRKSVAVHIRIPAGIEDGEVLEYQVNEAECKFVFRMHVMIR